MRFTNINIEGPDCSGKTTLYNKLHKKSLYKYNIHDRDTLSMYVHSVFYKRSDADFWYEKMIEEIKKLNSLYVIIVPSQQVLIKRIETRGDELQNSKTIILLRNIFHEAAIKLSNFPNVVFTELSDTTQICENVLEVMEKLNNSEGVELIKRFVMNTEEDEVYDLSFSETVDTHKIKLDILKDDSEGFYYREVLQSFIDNIQEEIDNNEDEDVKLSKKLIYTDIANISMIHLLYRKSKLNVYVILNSSNVITTLNKDFEFIKIASYKAAELLGINNDQININVNIRIAHKI